MYDRGGFMHQKKSGSMFLSATKAIMDHLTLWFQGAPNKIVSMGVVLQKEIYGLSNYDVYDFQSLECAFRCLSDVQGMASTLLWMTYN